MCSEVLSLFPAKRKVRLLASSQGRTSLNRPWCYIQDSGGWRHRREDANFPIVKTPRVLRASWANKSPKHEQFFDARTRTDLGRCSRGLLVGLAIAPTEWPDALANRGARKAA